MDTTRVTIAMPTLSRTGEEARTLRGAIASLAKVELPMFAVDGGSDAALLGYLQKLPNLKLSQIEPPHSSTLVRQIKTALTGAASIQAQFILYTEPDKQWFFERRLRDFLAFAERQSGADLILACRDASSFQTFPPTQQLTERLTNELVAHYLDLDVDFLYGPLLIRSELVRHLEAVPDDLGWGWRIFLMAVAKRLNKRLVPFVSHLPCPAEPANDETERARQYRLQQMAQNIRGAVLGLNHPL